MNQKLVRAFRNVPFIAGVCLLALGSSPLIIGGLLNEAGVIDIGTGLGLGLLFFFTFWPSAALIIAGFVIAVRRVDGAKG